MGIKIFQNLSYRIVNGADAAEIVPYVTLELPVQQFFTFQAALDEGFVPWSVGLFPFGHRCGVQAVEPTLKLVFEMA